MADEPVVLRLDATGADKVAAEVTKVTTATKDLKDAATQAAASFDWKQGQVNAAWQQWIDTQKKLKGTLGDTSAEAKGGIQTFAMMASAMQSSFGIGQAAAQGLGGAMNVLGMAIRGLMSPAGMATVAVVGLYEAITTLAKGAIETFEAMRRLTTQTGASVHDSDVAAKAFKLLGVETETLGMGLFRMGIHMENGSEQLERMGINTRKSTGELKTELEVFLEARDKISAMTSASEKNAAGMALFSRQYRAMAPAFKATTEEFQHYVQTAEKNSIVDEAFMERAKEYHAALEERQQRWEKIKTEIAEGVMPAAQLLEDALRGAVQWWAELTAKLSGRAVSGSIDELRGKISAMQEQLAARKAGVGKVYGAAAFLGLGDWDLESKALEDSIRATQAKMNDLQKKQEGKQKEHADKQAADAEAANQQLRSFEAKRAEEKLKMSSELLLREKAMQTQYDAERLQMETGSAEAGLRKKQELMQLEISEAKRMYEEKMAIERRRGGQVPEMVELKARQEMNAKILTAQAEFNRTELEMMKAQAAKKKELLAEEIAEIKARSEEKIKLREQAAKQELATVEIVGGYGGSAVEKIRITAQSEISAARDVASEKISSINRQIGAQRELAAQFPKDYAIQREVQDKIRALQGERVNVEIDSNGKILDARKKLVQELRGAAAEEAGIGASLEEKALGRLQARGKKKVTARDVAQEVGEMERTGVQAGGAYATGGKVKIEDLRIARELSPVNRKLAELGSDPYAALGASMRDMTAGLQGRPGPNLPSVLTNAQGATGAGVALYERKLDELKTSLDSGLDRVTDKWGAMLNEIPDMLIRKLEFQAAQQ